MQHRLGFIGSVVALITASAAACGSDDGKRSTRGNDGGAESAGGTSAPGDAGAGSDAAGQPGAAAQGGATVAGGAPGAGAETGEAGSEAAGGGAGGASSQPSFVIGAYVSPTGSDAEGDGTLESPFETLSPAAAMVGAGEAIGLLDGSHIVDYFVQVPDGAAIVAVNPGAATIGQMSGFNGGVTFQGSASLHGLHIGYAVNLFNASTGTINVTSSQFGAHGDGSGNDAAFVLTGDAELVLEAPSPDAPWYFEPSGGRVAQLSGTSKLKVSGGVFEGGIGGSVFGVYSGGATLSFTDVDFVDCSGGYVIALGNGGINANTSSLTLNNVTIDNSGSIGGILVGWGTPVIDVVDSVIDTADGIGIMIEGSNYAGAAAQTVNVEGSLVTGNDVGIRAYYYSKALVTLTDSNVDENAVGIRFQFTAEDIPNSLTMSGGSLANNTGVGFDAASETNKPIQLELRGVDVSGNGGHGLLLYGNAGSAFDLGTFADPGNNTLQNPGLGDAFAAIAVNAPTLVNAIGNTWLPSQQGATAAGAYVPSSGNYVEVTGAVTTGQNYRIQAAGQTLRL